MFPINQTNTFISLTLSPVFWSFMESLPTDVLFGDAFTEASLNVWKRFVMGAMCSSSSSSSVDRDASTAIPWPLFLRLYASEFRVPPDVLVPFETLLVERRRGGVTCSRWLPFTAYFSTCAWQKHSLLPPVDVCFASQLMAKTWFHGALTLDDTLQRLVVSSESDPQRFLVRFSETRWSNNLWTISFSSPLGVRNLRVACHRKNEPFVFVFPSSCSVPVCQDSSPATPLAATESSPSVSAGSPLFLPLLTSSSESQSRFSVYSLSSFNLPHSSSQGRVAVSESVLVPLLFFYILLPQPQDSRITVYSSITELVEAKFSSFQPASKPHEYTDDPFCFIPPS